ncbi:MAG: putative glutathione S-transferase [Chlamydiales bacterium]|jgi:putative glutathione S-transferase
MGKLVNGKWHNIWYDTESNKGEFVREDASFRNCLGNNRFPIEKDRYHLYVSYACPWAHRTLIFRKLKKLDQIISYSAVKPLMMENGWELDADSPGPEPLKYLYEVYCRTQSDYTGRVTVPVLWDKKNKEIVCNESSEIIRMFNTVFNDLTGENTDYYPEALKNEIDEINTFIYNNINNGVYRAGFATTQEVYNSAVHSLFKALDEIEARLSRQDYLIANTLTEADWRLFTTLIRFDSVYYGHFKCNIRSIESYPNLSKYIKKLYNFPSIKETVRFDQIKQHYYESHTSINPTQIVPVGPQIEYEISEKQKEKIT